LLAAANALTHSREYYANFVTYAYQRYLGRNPDAMGLNSWVTQMQHGLTDEQLEAGFLGSREYIARHGGNDRAWVIGMYQDLLYRTPQEQEVDLWVNALAAGAQPASVAHGFAASPEREAIRIRSNYETYLGRQASQAEVNLWLNHFKNGVSNETMAAGFVGSSEYFVKHGGSIDAWIKSAYFSVLGRQPDPAGLNYWRAFLQSDLR
jgi:hypothetical protein